MKLCVGLVKQSLAWQQVCQQEGVLCVQVNLNVDNMDEYCSVIVVDRRLTSGEHSAIENYLNNGGAVIGYGPHLLGVGGTDVRWERIDYVVSEHDEKFPGIQIVDLASYTAIPREANTLRTQSNTFAMFAGRLGGGHAVILPFDVEQMFYDSRAASKNFYFTRERLPAERVSLVSKGEVHHLVHRALEYLHHARGLPYAHLWYFPDGQRNLFAFRVDTDAAVQKDIDGLYRIAREHSISMSWYLDVKSHEPWLNHFSYMVNQEIGLHCYEHQTYDTYELNAKNMATGLHAMRSHGMNPKGFAAPFGIWNTGLARAIDEHGFEYSSEFSYAYDTLPMYPADNGTFFSALQVPIHPISIGSLRRVGYSEEQMTSYYRMCVDQKLARCEPLFFYHHPTHRGYNTVEHLFQYVQEKGIGGTTLGDFASWWKKRQVSPLSLHLEGNMVRVELPDAFDLSVHVRLTNASGYEAIVRPQTLLDLSSLVWTKSAPMPEVPSDIRRLRDFDPRATLGNLYNTLIRKLR